MTTFLLLLMFATIGFAMFVFGYFVGIATGQRQTLILAEAARNSPLRARWGVWASPAPTNHVGVACFHQESVYIGYETPEAAQEECNRLMKSNVAWVAKPCVLPDTLPRVAERYRVRA